MTSQTPYLAYIKDWKYEKFFADELKKATAEQVKGIGVAIFGENLGPLSYSYPEFIEGFKKKYGVSECSTIDKVKMNYINGQVIKDDYYIERLINVERHRERVLVKNQTFDEAMQEIRKIGVQYV